MHQLEDPIVDITDRGLALGQPDIWKIEGFCYLALLDDDFYERSTRHLNAKSGQDFQDRRDR